MDMSYYKKLEPVFGAWNIKRLIGEGNFGKVFEIEREDFGRKYTAALKVITIPQSESEIKSVMADGMDDASITVYYRGFVEEIVDEFSLMANLKGNSNIVSYEDHMVLEHKNEIGWDILIRMELLTPLIDHIAEKGMSRKDIVRLGIDLCRALEFCQKQNIIHRDIKPENIFVSKNGDYKLGDFGIARTAEKTTSGLSKKGTYNYMAPEVYLGQPYGPSVDIYSLGLVLYRLLNNNRAPFLPAYPNPITFSDRENANARRINGEQIPAPANADAALAAAVLKACAYQAADRYESPEAMRLQLEQLLSGQDKQENVCAFTASATKTATGSTGAAGAQSPTPAAPIHTPEPLDATASVFHAPIQQTSVNPAPPAPTPTPIPVDNSVSDYYDKTESMFSPSDLQRARQAEQARQAQLAEQARQAQLAEQARQAQLAEQARQAQLAEQARQAQLAEQARQAQLAEQARQARKAEQARNPVTPPTETESKKKRKSLLILGIVAGVLVLALVLGIVLIALSIDGGESTSSSEDVVVLGIPMPDVVGKTEQEAKTTLEAIGATVVVEYEFDSAAAGTVIAASDVDFVYAGDKLTIRVSKGPEEAPPEVVVSPLTLDKTSLSLNIGRQHTLTAIGGDGTYTWTVGNAKVATVSDGVITAKGAGTTKVTVTSGDQTATCTVTVKDPNAPTLKLNKTAIALNPGETYTLKASGGNGSYTWKSSNTKVATIKNGTVTAVSAGKVKLTVTSGGQSATCTLTVNSAPACTHTGWLSDSSITVRVGGSNAIYAYYSNNSGFRRYVHASSNTSVATVDAGGKVVGVAPGTATITTTFYFDNCSTPHKATCKVTVVPAP